MGGGTHPRRPVLSEDGGKRIVGSVTIPIDLDAPPGSLQATTLAHTDVTKLVSHLLCGRHRMGTDTVIHRCMSFTPGQMYGIELAPPVITADVRSPWNFGGFFRLDKAWFHEGQRHVPRGVICSTGTHGGLHFVPLLQRAGGQWVEADGDKAPGARKGINLQELMRAAQFVVVTVDPETVSTDRPAPPAPGAPATTTSDLTAGGATAGGTPTSTAGTGGTTTGGGGGVGSTNVANIDQSAASPDETANASMLGG